MPPQQAYGLLDFIDDRFHFGAHRIPLLIFVKRPGFQEGAPGRELEREITLAGCRCKPSRFGSFPAKPFRYC